MSCTSLSLQSPMHKRVFHPAHHMAPIDFVYLPQTNFLVGVVVGRKKEKMGKERDVTEVKNGVTDLMCILLCMDGGQRFSSKK